MMIDATHERAGWRKCQRQNFEVKVRTSPAAGLSKIVVGEVVSCEDVPDTHLHVCQVNGEEENCQIVLWCSKCSRRHQGSWWLKQVPVLPTIIRLKREIRRLGVTFGHDLLSPVSWHFWFCRAKGICGWNSNPAWRRKPGVVFSLSGLDDEIIELSPSHQIGQMLCLCGVAHEVAAIYDKSVHLKIFRW